MDTKGLQKEFIDWCKSNKKQPKSKEETQQLFVAFMKEKHPEEYKAAMENQQKQAQKALHGAKLQYIRSLKNQCPEGEELYYYKKGGSVGCGCKKKEDGGEVRKAGSGCSAVVEKFKKMRTGGDTVVNGSTKQPTIDGTKKMSEDPNKNTIWDTKLKKMRKMTPEEIARTEKNKADARQGKGEGTPQRKCGGKVKKHQEGSVITKFKMHRQGGSLNGIPFIRKAQ